VGETSSIRRPLRPRGSALCVLLVLVFLLAAAPGAAAEVRPFGTLKCIPREGVRFCEGSTATRVKTFDGVPLDVNVTLPSRADSGLPLVVLLHGWGGEKVGFGESKPWAERGYAVLAYTARGFHESCGSASSRAADPEGCAEGWIRLADARYEVRDTQYLSSLLADQGIVDPQRIGATGASYGGGQSLALATLVDRVMLPDGTLAPWKSPGGLDMRIAGAAPIVPWSDLVYSLVPNGSTLDYVLTPRNASLSPVGVKKESYIDVLFASGETNGYYAPPGADPDADLRTWYARLSAGEPYDGDPVVDDALDEIASHHSPYQLYLAHKSRPAPLLISNGFTDDLFPVHEAVRYANRVLAEQPGAEIAQLHFDYGHPRGQNKDADIERLRQAVHDWLDRHVKGDLTAPARTGVETWTQTCGGPSDGPFSAPTWAELHPGEVRFGSSAPQTSASITGDERISAAIDPITGGGACATTNAANQPGVATYRGAAARGGYTLLGSPTVIAQIDVTGPHAQVAARLWDVSPSGRQTLVTRALYRPRNGGRQVFQLHPNGWLFEAGHVPKLELLGKDFPYARPSNGAFTLEFSDLELRLPVHEAPGTTPQIKDPKRPVIPGG
jgi:hypothetical protein